MPKPGTDDFAAFDHHADDHHRHMRETWTEMRALPGLPRSELHGGFHILTRFEDVMAVAVNHETFISGEGINIPALPQHAPHIPVELDPPLHGKFRQLLAKFLTRRRVEDMAPEVRRIVRRLLDGMAGETHLDFVTAFAKPLPIAVTLDLLGLPLSDAALLDFLLTTQRKKRGEPAGRQAAADMVQYLEDNFAARMRGSLSPDDDILAAVLLGEIDGRPLTQDEKISIIRLLLFGGFDTTAMTLAATMHWLAAHPADADRLRAHDEIPDAMVEEFIRYASPAGYLRRTVAKPATLAGCPLHKGDRVLMSYAAANRDPTRFPCPDALDLDRSAAGHLAFGAGIHRCVGAWLAKLELRIAIAEILRRYDRIALDQTQEIMWDCGENLGMISLPLILTPGAGEAGPNHAAARQGAAP